MPCVWLVQVTRQATPEYHKQEANARSVARNERTTFAKQAVLTDANKKAVLCTKDYQCKRHHRVFVKCHLVSNCVLSRSKAGIEVCCTGKQ